MRYYYLCIILLISACLNKQEAQEIDKADVSEVLSVISEQQKAWNQGDIEAFMKGYWQSENLRFSGKYGTNYGWQSTLDSYRKSFPNRDDMGKLRFEIDTVYTDRLPFISVQGQWTIHRYDTIGGRFVLLFDQIQDEWKIIEDHTW